MKFVVCYDISDDKLRTKIVKVLEKYGLRVQYSVFEFDLLSSQILKMRHELKNKKVFDLKKINFSIYPICEKCSKKIERYGEGKILDQKNVVF